MKRSVAVIAAFLGLSLLGCGGPVSEPTAQPEAAPVSGEEATVSQFGTCTALCPGGQSVSCSGTTCSATDGQGVMCDGVSTPCFIPTCSGLPECSLRAGQTCYTLNETELCCDGGYSASVVCSRQPNSRLLKWVTVY